MIYELHVTGSSWIAHSYWAAQGTPLLWNTKVCHLVYNIPPQDLPEVSTIRFTALQPVSTVSKINFNITYPATYDHFYEFPHVFYMSYQSSPWLIIQAITSYE